MAKTEFEVRSLMNAEFETIAMGVLNEDGSMTIKLDAEALAKLRFDVTKDSYLTVSAARHYTEEEKAALRANQNPYTEKIASDYEPFLIQPMKDRPLQTIDPKKICLCGSVFACSVHPEGKQDADASS